MNPRPSVSASPASFSSSRQEEILRELAELAAQTANAQIDSLTTRLADEMLRASAATPDEKEARRFYHAAGLLKKNRYPFYYVTSERLKSVLQRETHAIRNAPPPADLGEAPPSLPPDMEIDKKLSLIKASQAIENEHAERMTMLNLRLAALLGREELATTDNPFRPHVFLSVLHDSWCEFQPDTSAHHLVFRLLGSRLCIDMGPILHALNGLLARRGVAPTSAPVAVAETPSPAAAPEPGDDPLAEALRQLFPAQPVRSGDRPVVGDFPALFQDDVVQTSVARNELISYLNRAQSKLSGLLGSDIRQQMPELAVSDADDSAIGLIARIFDSIRDNTHIAEELRMVIVSLHLPILKCALTDRDFFFRNDHPARRVIELMVRLAAGCDPAKGNADPAYQLIARCVRRIGQEADQHIAVFAETAAELDTFLRRDASAIAEALATPINQALQQEKTILATKTARHEVALRVGTGEVVAFVETFLEDKWVSVLTLAYTADDKPQAAAAAIKTMDDLVWSVKPKITAEERKELLSKLPAMVAALNKWLDLIKWDDPARVRFFDELAKCHASIVRAPLELSPQRQIELAIQVAQKAAERREKRLARQTPPTPPDAFDQEVAALEGGTWVEFRQRGRPARRLRLAWISPLRNLYLFASRDRKEAMSLSAEDLAQAMRGNHAQIIAGAGLVGRALAEALGVDPTRASNTDRHADAA